MTLVSTPVPLNDLRRYAAEIEPRLVGIAGDVLARGHYVLGPAVGQFEREFAAYCGTEHAIGVANGTDALELALRANGVAAGHTVVVAANAAMYGTGAILAVGATPRFSDVDSGSMLLTAATIADAIAISPTMPAAVIVTHLYGLMAEMQPIVTLCREHGIRLIEDCAQAHGARRDGGMAGSFGDAGCFSFYPTKNLGAIGDGGAVVTNDDDIAVAVRSLRQYGWGRKYHNERPGGRNSRLDEMQAAFLSSLLPDLEQRNGRRRKIAAKYSGHIRHPGIRCPSVLDPSYVAHLFVIRCEARDSLAAHLAGSGIATDIHYPLPDHRQPVLGGRHAGLSLPATEAACSEVLTLPCFPELTDEECEAVIAACNAWKAP